MVLFWVGLFNSLMGLISVGLYRTHVLLSLMSLELCTLGLFMMTIVYLSFISGHVSLSFFVLVLSVCEASLGLVLMVVMSRFLGNDSLLLSQVKC